MDKPYCTHRRRCPPPAAPARPTAEVTRPSCRPSSLLRLSLEPKKPSGDANGLRQALLSCRCTAAAVLPPLPCVATVRKQAANRHTAGMPPPLPYMQAASERPRAPAAGHQHS